MNNFDLEKTLSTMVICVDSREHATAEAKKRWESFGVPYRIQALTTQNPVLKSLTRIWAAAHPELPLMMQILILWDLKSTRTTLTSRKNGSKSISHKSACLLTGQKKEVCYAE